jgi:hypothetical protein
MFYGVQGTLVSISSSLNDPVWFPLSHIGQNSDNTYNTSGEIGPHLIIYIILGVCVSAFVASLFLPKYFNKMGKVSKDNIQANPDKPYGQDT